MDINWVNTPGAFNCPKVKQWQVKAVFSQSILSRATCQYPDFKSNVEKQVDLPNSLQHTLTCHDVIFDLKSGFNQTGIWTEIRCSKVASAMWEWVTQQTPRQGDNQNEIYIQCKIQSMNFVYWSNGQWFSSYRCSSSTIKFLDGCCIKVGSRVFGQYNFLQ